MSLHCHGDLSSLAARPGLVAMNDAQPGPVAAGCVVGTDGRVRPEWAASDALLRDYYDTEWGVPVRDERGIFERISLEAFQSGLSWATILRKRPAFRNAFEGFEPDVVAGFGSRDIARLMGDTGIVRNNAKIEATIGNARATVALRAEGGLERLVWSFQPDRTPVPGSPEDLSATSPESVALAAALRTRGFRFVGPTTMYALMKAIGLVDPHPLGSDRRGCSGLWNPDGTRQSPG